MQNSSPTNPLAAAMGNTSGSTNSLQKVNTSNTQNTQENAFQPQKKKGLNLKTILGSVLLLIVILGSAAGFYLTQYTDQDIRQQAAGIGDTITVTQDHQNDCINYCIIREAQPGIPNPVPDPQGYCYQNAGVYVRHYKCDDVKTGGQGCNENGTTVCGGACTGQTFGFDQNQQCGTQQIDLGCASPRGTYGNVGFISYWGPNACNEPTNPPSTDPPTTNPPTTNPPTTNPPTTNPPNVEVSCTGFTGTLKTGPITTLDAPLNFNITSIGTGVTKVELVMHGDFTPPAMGNGWATIASDSTPGDGSFTGTVTYRQMVDALVATGHNRQMLLDKGIIYFANVYGPKGFCTGANVWSGTGEPCTRNPQCNGKALLPPDVACTNFTGTLKTGPITDVNTPLNYTVSSSGGSYVNKVELVAHGNFTPPAMGTAWATIATDSTPGDGTFTGSTTYGQMVDSLVATGHDRQKLMTNGIVYFANVYGPKGFCTGANVWSGTGEPCTRNPQCNGTAILPTTQTAVCNSSCVLASDFDTCTNANPLWSCQMVQIGTNQLSPRCRLTSNPSSPTCTPAVGPMCKDIAILDKDGNELDPKAIPSSFYIGQIIQLRCAPDNIENPLIQKYQFRITEPNGQVVEGNTLNPAGSTRISLPYTINQSGQFKAQCRICLTDGTCQEYTDISK